MARRAASSPLSRRRTRPAAGEPSLPVRPATTRRSGGSPGGTPLQGPARLDEAGYFADAAGQRVVPLGVNYWPGSCGVEMWVEWPEAEIQRDLDLVRDLGLNCVRWFLRWQDFEPTVGRYDARAFARLEQLLGWHRERGLWAHPSLFVGFMSGGLFWPAWRGQRNVFADPVMRRRAVALTRRVAAVLARHADVILAVDQGNELCCVPDSSAASPAAVREWCRVVNAAIHRAFPRAVRISGNEQNQVVNDTGWRLGEQDGCDLYSMHTYPVGAWHSLAFDGMTDPLGRSLLPFYVKCARAWGPVLVQEFGTLLTRGAAECAGYLRHVLPACWQAGANGFLWWCLRDIQARGHPYNKNAFEGLLGLVDDAGRVKPGLDVFLQFARELTQAAGAPARPPAATTGLYWPREYYGRENPRNPGNDPRTLSRQMGVAHHALERAGRAPGVVRRGSDLAPGGTLVVAGALLTAVEVTELTAWVEAGGRLVVHGPDVLTWGEAMEHLLGAEPLDFGAPVPRAVRAFGRGWTLTHYPRDVFPKVRLRPGATGVVRASVRGAADAAPVLWKRSLGQGAVVVCLSSIDQQFAQTSAEVARRGEWARWYRGMLAWVEAAGRRATGKRRQSR